nr:ribonuclease H-like domain-containing protein [Tanacetum cinerariifolium]
MQRKKNDVKARTTLLLSFPDEHQLRFSKYKTAKELWAAILKTFDGNKATKKTKKNLLKQQYGNFKAEGSKTLEHTFNRLQVIVGQLQFMDVEIEQDDLNQKFLTTKHNSRNEDGNTACVATASTNVPTDSASLATISQDTAWAYIASQSSGSQIKFEDINQIDEDDIEEMDIKWNMALLSMRADNAESKVFDNSLCSKDCKKNNDSLNSKITDLTDKLFLFDANNFIYHYKLALAQVESRLVEYKEREVKYIEKIRTLEYFNESYKECIETLKKKLETLKQEKERVDGKLAGLLTASKDLDNLIESQRSDKNKEWLGYTVVPPPTAQLYLSPKKDLSWTCLPECADDTVTDYSRPSPTVESTSEEDQNKNPSVSENVASPVTPKPFIKFVKPKDSQSKSKTNKKESPKKSPVKYAKQYNKKPNGSSQNKIDDKDYRDSGCSRHIAGNISYLSDYEPFDGGYVSFGQGGCKITGKGTIKTECIVLGRDFKLLDDANILLRTHRQHNMYSIDLNNIVPHRDLTCLVAKASADECMLWHRRLGHLNFKTMNKLVRHNLVRGLPTKCFENDHTCTACLKGKQHKAS